MFHTWRLEDSPIFFYTFHIILILKIHTISSWRKTEKLILKFVRKCKRPGMVQHYKVYMLCIARVIKSMGAGLNVKPNRNPDKNSTQMQSLDLKSNTEIHKGKTSFQQMVLIHYAPRWEKSWAYTYDTQKLIRNGLQAWIWGTKYCF